MKVDKVNLGIVDIVFLFAHLKQTNEKWNRIAAYTHADCRRTKVYGSIELDFNEPQFNAFCRKIERIANAKWIRSYFNVLISKMVVIAGNSQGAHHFSKQTKNNSRFSAEIKTKSQKFDDKPVQIFMSICLFHFVPHPVCCNKFLIRIPTNVPSIRYERSDSIDSNRNISMVYRLHSH